MKRKLEFAVAAVVWNTENNSEVLAVQRPAGDPALPSAWGLPAIVVADGELPEDAVRRLGHEKLSTTVEPKSFLGIKYLDRGDYDLILMDIEATLTGNAPDVSTAPTTGTKYVDQKWTSDLTTFIPAARNGSLCSRILLESKNINWEV